MFGGCRKILHLKGRIAPIWPELLGDNWVNWDPNPKYGESLPQKMSVLWRNRGRINSIRVLSLRIGKKDWETRLEQSPKMWLCIGDRSELCCRVSLVNWPWLYPLPKWVFQCCARTSVWQWSVQFRANCSGLPVQGTVLRTTSSGHTAF